MPRMRSIVNHHARTARTRSNTTRPSRTRSAASAGPGPAAAPEPARSAAITGSGSPGELRRRDARPALVLDPERVDVRPRRLGRIEFGRRRVEDPHEPDGLPGLDAERHDVLDLEVDRVTDADAMEKSVLDDLDRGPLDAEHLTDQRNDPLHRTALLPGHDGGQQLHLLVGRAGVDEQTKAPV